MFFIHINTSTIPPVQIYILEKEIKLPCKNIASVILPFTIKVGYIVIYGNDVFFSDIIGKLFNSILE
jgi:hypothetical protein